MFVEGTEVSPRRAFEEFWRCEQTFARLTRDMMTFSPSRAGLEGPGGQKRLALTRDEVLTRRPADIGLY